MLYRGSDKHKIALFENKQDKLVEGDNITLTPQQDGTVRISAEGGGASSLSDLSDVNISSPENGQALVYDESTDKWIAGEAGQVDGVKVNGTSVVDANKVAQITSYKEITQAEYDALPASKLTDGILYCIKDTGVVEGEQFAPVIYSLAERQVGTWIDGKPLYEITLDCGFAPNNDTIEYPTGLTDIDTIFIVSGMLFNPTAKTSIPLNNVRPDNSIYGNGCLYIGSTNTIRVIDKYDRHDYKVYVTLRYTKTTDVPGSGSWGTDGVPMVHYDGNEKIVGTWFGDTLYERTIYYDNADGITVTSQNDYEIATISNIVIRSARGSLLNSTSGNSYALPYVAGAKTIGIVYKSSNSLCIRSAGDTWGSVWKFYVTIQYTKSS